MRQTLTRAKTQKRKACLPRVSFSAPLRLCASLALVFAFATAAFGNSVIVRGTPYGAVHYGYAAELLWILFPLTLLIEGLVVWVFLRPAKIVPLLVGVLLVHLVTYPLTVFCSMAIGYGAEIVPVVLEMLLYGSLGRFLAKRGLMKASPARMRCLAISLTANFGSFAIGLAGASFIPAPPASQSAIARVRSDQRALGDALEKYCADHSVYPERLERLTTPAAYIPALPFDATFRRGAHGERRPIQYFSFRVGAPSVPYYLLWCAGSDRDYDFTMENLRALADRSASGVLQLEKALRMEYTYDPTNGTGSNGDVWRPPQ